MHNSTNERLLLIKTQNKTLMALVVSHLDVLCVTVFWDKNSHIIFRVSCISIRGELLESRDRVGFSTLHFCFYF